MPSFVASLASMREGPFDHRGSQVGGHGQRYRKNGCGIRELRPWRKQLNMQTGLFDRQLLHGVGFRPLGDVSKEPTSALGGCLDSRHCRTRSLGTIGDSERFGRSFFGVICRAIVTHCSIAAIVNRLAETAPLGKPQGPRESYQSESKYIETFWNSMFPRRPPHSDCLGSKCCLSRSKHRK